MHPKMHFFTSHWCHTMYLTTHYGVDWCILSVHLLKGGAKKKKNERKGKEKEMKTEGKKGEKKEKDKSK